MSDKKTEEIKRAIDDYLPRTPAPAPEGDVPSVRNPGTGNVGKVTGREIPDAPTRLVGPPRLETPSSRQSRLDRYEEAKEIYGEDERKVLEGIPRVPVLVDQLLQFAPTQEDQLNALQHAYGPENVEYRPHFGIYVVRERDPETGKWNVFKTDEPEITGRDVLDVGQGVIAASPEIATGAATASSLTSKFPQLPQSKAGLLAVSAASAGVGEATGALKDYLFRKYGIKTDPKTGEILKRRAGYAVLGTGLGYGAGRMMGGGKGVTLSGISEDATSSADDLIAKVGTEAEERLGIKQTAGQSTLRPSTVKLESHAQTAASRVPQADDPMLKFDASLKEGSDAARSAVAGGGDINYADLRKRLSQEMQTANQAIRSQVSQQGDEALSNVTRDISKTGVKSLPAGTSAEEVATDIQSLARNRVQEMSSDVSAQYQAVEKELADRGVGQFVDFKNLRKAILEWRESHAPKARVKIESEIPDSKILDAKGNPVTAKQKVVEESRVAVGEFGDADSRANQWLATADEPQTLQEAQTFISKFGELSRAKSTEVGDAGGFGQKALNDFYRAAKSDLSDSFNSLKIDAKLSTMWDEANLSHYNKIEKLNKSDLVQSLIREGREGGLNNSRELFSRLLAGKGKTQDLKLLKEILGPDGSRKLQSGLYDDVLGKNTVNLKDGSQVMDMSQLQKYISNLDDSFLSELVESPEAARNLKGMLEAWENTYGIHGKIGKNAGLDVRDFTEMMDLIDSGQLKNAKELMRKAVVDDYNRRLAYFNRVSKDTMKGSLDIIESNPEQFVDDLLLSGDKQFVTGTLDLFKKLPIELQGDVRRHVADRLIARAIDIQKTPVSRLVSKKGGEIDPRKLIKELYGTDYRLGTVRQILSDQQVKTLDDLAKVMIARSRYKEIAGAAGKMATETAIGTGSVKNMLGQVTFSKAVFYPVVQDFLSKGASRSSTLHKIYMAMDDIKPRSVMTPSRASMIQALAVPARDEGVRPVYDHMISARDKLNEEYGEEGGKFFDDLFGSPTGNSEIRKSIEDALGN
mgnify:FL=1